MAKGYARSVFRELLLQQREKMSLSELALRLKRSKSTIMKWLSGGQSPTRETMVQVCTRLGISTDLLLVDAAGFHDLWKCQHLTFEVLNRRYYELTKAEQIFEAAAVVNLAGVLLLRELSQHGHPMRLTTSDLGDVQMLSAMKDKLMTNTVWRVSGSPELGIQAAIYSEATGEIMADWVSISSENVVLLLDGCGKLQIE